MEREIRYLYEYEKSTKRRNAGFVKVERDKESTTLSIYGKGIGSVSVFLFWMEENICQKVFLARLQTKEYTVNQCVVYTPEDTGCKRNYEKAEGILLENEKDTCYAALWKECRPDFSLRKNWELPPPKQEPVQVVTEKKKQGKVWRKIDRQEIAKLPRCEWKLANNSFLMHGYYNYHYLIVLKEKEVLYVGVPGIYHPEEEEAAKRFGFGWFVKSTELEEKEESEGFGYWCRQVSGSWNW